MNSTWWTLTHDGNRVEAEVEYEYTPFEAATWECPGQPESLIVLDIYIDRGQSIIEHFTQEEIEELADAILANFHEWEPAE